MWLSLWILPMRAPLAIVNWPENDDRLSIWTYCGSVDVSNRRLAGGCLSVVFSCKLSRCPICLVLTVAIAATIFAHSSSRDRDGGGLNCYLMCPHRIRSHCPRSLSLVQSFTSRTLGSWVQFPLEVWIYLYFYCVDDVLCRERPCDGPISQLRCPTKCL
jgi:hypothetical protein